MQISKWVALGVAAFCLVAVGGVVNMPHLYYMAAMLITLPAVSYALGWYTLRGLEFRRHAPTPIWEGEETDITYSVCNKTRISRFFVAIQESTSRHVESLEMNPALFNVSAGSTMEIKNRVRFDRRGVFHSGSFDVSALDPLGVFTFTRTIPSTDETVVYPMPRPLASVSLHGAEKLGWNDTLVLTRHGDGVDTSGVRGYLPGDPLRHIHWRQTARTGQLTVIEFEETQSVNLRIALDTAQSGVVGDEPNTSLEYAIRAAATIARDAIQNGAMVELVVANRTGPDIAQAWNGLMGERGDGQLYTLMDALARVEPQATTSLSDLLASTIGTVPRGTTVLAICIQPDAELTSMVAKCMATGVVVTLIYINGSTFPKAKSMVPLQTIDNTIAEVAAMGVQVFTLGWNPEGTLQAISLD